MTIHDQPEADIVARSFTEHSCTVTSIIYDPADPQQILYGTVTCDGVLVGSHYCADRIRQRDWRIVTADGHDLTLDGNPVRPLDAVHDLLDVSPSRTSDKVTTPATAGRGHGRTAAAPTGSAPTSTGSSPRPPGNPAVQQWDVAS